MTNRSSRARRRRASVLALGATAALAAVGIASAQSSDPLVVITASTGQATITGAGALQQGPTAFSVQGTGKEADLALFELKPGVSVATAKAAAAALKGPPTELQKYGRFVMGATALKGTPTYTAVVSLLSRTYVLVDATRKPKVVGSFTVGTGQTGATVPTPDATVTLSDYKIAGPAKLPTSGVLRVQNHGKSPHFLAMLRAGSPTAARKLATLLHKGKDRAASKLIKGDTSPVGLISPGVVNDVIVNSVPKGSYVLACFYADKRSKGKEHSMLGMEKVVTVG